MAIFVVIWPYLLTTKIICLQKKNFGHTNAGCVGVSMTISSVLSYLAYTGFTVFSSIWLSIWSTDPDIANRDKYLSVYGVLGVLQVN